MIKTVQLICKKTIVVVVKIPRFKKGVIFSPEFRIPLAYEDRKSCELCLNLAKGINTLSFIFIPDSFDQIMHKLRLQPPSHQIRIDRRSHLIKFQCDSSFLVLFYLIYLKDLQIEVLPLFLHRKPGTTSTSLVKQQLIYFILLLFFTLLLLLFYR